MDGAAVTTEGGVVALVSSGWVIKCKLIQPQERTCVEVIVQSWWGWWTVWHLAVVTIRYYASCIYASIWDSMSRTTRADHVRV